MDDRKASDFLWKIVLCGDSFVGKTTIRKRAMGEHFAEEYISTVGADFSSYKLKLGDLTIGFQVWDLAGQDKYKYIRSSFYGGATGCFLVFDVTNPKSMKNLSTWVDEAIRYSNGTIEIFVICANKIDLKNRREISREMGEKYALALRESSGLQCEYIETSALTGENVDIAFDRMAKCLLEREGVSPAKIKEEVIPAKSKQPQPVVKDPIPTPKEVEPIKTKIIETIPTVKKSIVVEDEGDAETERLIAEVMEVLNETNEIIIGREKTDDGEKAITVTKDTIERRKPEKEQEPKISTQLESVLKQINSKLDTLTTRLRDLEEEISSVKEDEIEISDEIEREVPETNDQDELDILAQLPLPVDTNEPQKPISSEKEVVEPPKEQEPELNNNLVDEIVDMDESESSIEPATNIESNIEELKDEYDEDQEILESILDTVDDLPDNKDEIDSEQEDRSLDQIVDINSEVKDEATDNIRNLENIPDNGLIDIPDEEPLVPIESEDYEDIEDTHLIGTELSSAMISELKDMDEKEETDNNSFMTQPLNLEKIEEKNLCPICGEELKYIRQYKKFYCVKCGRYLI